jgi:hypothetical protein
MLFRGRRRVDPPGGCVGRNAPSFKTRNGEKQAAEQFPTCRLLGGFRLTEWVPRACGPHCKHMRLDHERIVNMLSLRCISASSAYIRYYRTTISRRMASKNNLFKLTMQSSCTWPVSGAVARTTQYCLPPEQRPS